MLYQGFRFFVALSILVLGAQSGAAQKPSDQKPSEISIKAFAQLKSVRALRFSPDGTRIAHLVPYQGREWLAIKPVGAGEPVFIPPAEDAEISWFFWANKNRIILAYAYTGQRYTLTTREIRLFGVDANGKNLINIVKPRKKKNSAVRFGIEERPAQRPRIIDVLSDDPDHILLTLDGDQDGRSEVRRVNINTGRYKEIVWGKHGIQHYRTDQQNELRFAWGYDKTKFRQIYKSPITNKWRDIEKTSWGQKGFELISFSPDPKIIYVKGENEHGRQAIYQVDLEKDTILSPVFSHDKVDYDRIVDHPITDNAVGVQYTVDKPKTVYFDQKLRNIQKTVDNALKDTVNDIVSIEPNKKQYLIYAQSDVEPGVYYLLDMVRKNLDFISETMPGIVPEDMSPVQAVSYKARDAVDIPAYLTVPKDKEARNLPTVILVHGGPNARDNQMFNYTVQFLASRGYAVLQPNFRGSTGYGAAFEDAGDLQWGGVMQDDVTDGTKWLIEQGIADPQRVCIVGSSYGGYAAAMGLIKTPNLFQCGISTNGVMNIPRIIGFDKKFIGGRVWTKSMGLKGEDPKTVSPYHRADEIKVPMLIIHAKDDHRVRYSQAEAMAKKLKKLKKDVTLVTLEDGDHHLDTEASRIRELTAVGAFLKKHIGPSESLSAR